MGRLRTREPRPGSRVPLVAAGSGRPLRGPERLHDLASGARTRGLVRGQRRALAAGPDAGHVGVLLQALHGVARDVVEALVGVEVVRARGVAAEDAVAGGAARVAGPSGGGLSVAPPSGPQPPE